MVSTTDWGEGCMHHRKTRITATGKLSCKTLVLAVAIAACLPVHAAAAEPDSAPDTVVNFSIPAGDLSVALERFSTQSGIQAMYRQDLVAGKRSRAVNEPLSPSAALEKMLEGTGIISERVNDKTRVLRAAPVSNRSKQGDTQQQDPRASGARNSPERESVRDFDEIVVVGSRLGKSPVESAMPIKVITRDQIDRSGAGNIAQALSNLSEISVNNNGDREIATTSLDSAGNTNSTSVQMRGLPRGTVLILLNGRRAGSSALFNPSGQFDLSTIPLSLVERIEILSAGSSAVYGGDGLAGVVNIVLRQDASGLEFRYRKSFADGYNTSQASFMWGKSWQNSNLTISGSWAKQGYLSSAKRALTSNQDYRRFGGRDFRASSGNPATIYSLDGCPDVGQCFVPLSDRGPLPGLDSSVATVPEGSSGVGLTPEDFRGTQGQEGRASYIMNLRSAEESFGFTANGRVQLMANVEGIVEAAYTRRDVPAYQLPFGLDSGRYNVEGGVVPASHPFNPFGVAVGVSYTYPNSGVFSGYSQDHARGLVGLKGELGRFDWEVANSLTKDKGGIQGASGWDAAKIISALKSTDPATTINPFVSDGSPPAKGEFLRSLAIMDSYYDASSRTSVLSGHIRGPLIRLPAGDVVALAGIEKSRQSVALDNNDPFVVANRLSGDSSGKSTFAEVRVPVFSPREGSSYERLALTGAMRSESSDRFSDATLTKAFGLEARPSGSLLLRSTYSTAFRPLLVFSAVSPIREFDTWVQDPKFDDMLYPIKWTLSGGVPSDLNPERSSTMTIGAVYRPSSDWNYSITYWNTKFRDRISYIGMETMLMNEDIYEARIHRNPITGFVERIDGRQVNISVHDVEGADIAFDGHWATSVGEFASGVSASYTYKYKHQLTNESPIISSVGVHSLDGWAPKWKIVPRVSWNYSDLIGATVVGRYVSSYKDSAALSTGPNAGMVKTLGGFWIFDANLGLSLDRFLKRNSMFSGSRLTLGSTNLFGELPEYCAGCYASGYDAGQYDIVGRTLYAELHLSF